MNRLSPERRTHVIHALVEGNSIRATCRMIVDIMLDGRDPAKSLRALARRAIAFPMTYFAVIDHHPAEGLPKPPSNVHLDLVDSVYRCCVGEPSDLMVVAAICDGEEAQVRHIACDRHRLRAVRVRRAAADHGGLAGSPLLTLLRRRQWRLLEQLGAEPADMHRSFYGRRGSSLARSPALWSALEAGSRRAGGTGAK